MAYCAKCGVELEDGVKACPLCGTRVEGRDVGPAEGPEVDREEAGKEGRLRNLLVMEVLSVVFGIAALLCLGIDLWSTRGRLGWSLLALDGFAMAWLLMAMPLILGKKPWILFAVLAPGELLLLFILDLLDGNGFWFLRLGMPIYLLSLVVILTVIVLAMISKLRGLNILGLILAGAAVECLGLESILSLALGQGIVLYWSPVVALSCIPASGLAFYFHYRVIKKSLGRSFHL